MTLIVLLLTISSFDISGYVETRPYVLWGDSVRVSGYTRGWLEGKTGERTYGARIAFDAIVPYDTIAEVVNLPEMISISRCVAWIGPEHARLSIGKQRIDMGIARLFRPLDVFNRTNYFEPGYERSGITAVFAYYAIDRVSSIRGLYTPTYDWQHTTAGLSVRTTILHNDVGIVGIQNADESSTLIGGEIAGELLVGYWGEYAFVQDSIEDYSTFTIGMDYSFPFRLYAMVEFFFDGSGVDDPSLYDYSALLLGTRQTLAQQYLYCSISTIPLPFDVFRPSVSMLGNIIDNGIVLIPQVSVMPFENTDIAVGANIFIGSSECEFKNLMPFDGAAYVWLKVYF